MSVPPRVTALPPVFVTLDVEGDNEWAHVPATTTENARFVPRFHALCARYGMRPVYLTTLEMATSPEFRALAREVLARGEGEVGMHLHPWNTPPDVQISAGSRRARPYLTQYGEEALRQKIARLTGELEDAFDTPIRSHRGGRWAFNTTCARLLLERGYRVDTSVTPHVSWRRPSAGDDDRDAPDYSGFRDDPYFIDLDDIRLAGSSGLLEVPMTTCRIEFERPPPDAPFFVRWMRPNGRNLKSLLWLIGRVIEERRKCLVLMLHSSELMPGGSPGLAREQDVEALYRDLEVLFETLRQSFRPLTLSEFQAEQVAVERRPAILGA